MTLKKSNGYDELKSKKVDDQSKVDERSYHDKNLMINWNRETDRCYVNTFGTFWHGSFAELLEKLQSVALPSNQKAGNGSNNISD